MESTYMTTAQAFDNTGTNNLRYSFSKEDNIVQVFTSALKVAKTIAVKENT
jgi:hypothetical protein